ncbi:MAG: type II toxin-antitoxin system HicA family toxin [Lachnospiraceae bacterium]|nr:type II toxin-antitoxin system HicA family toxin [Lachnospiraceae bacterium]
MASKEKLLKKLYREKLPRNFTKQELDTLMKQCNCIKGQGGRGSGIRYYHVATGRVVAFDEPHPENNLYPYQVKMIRQFLKEIGEYKEDTL